MYGITDPKGVKLSMKKTISVIAAFGIAASVCAPISAADTYNGGLMLHYSFSELNNSGIVTDDSGNGNDGIISGDAELEYGRMYFDGKDDYITMPEGLLKDTDSVTVAINMRPEFDEIHYFAWNFGNSSSTGYMFLNTSRPDAKLRFAITPAGNGDEEALASDNDVKAGTWSNIIVTIDGNEGKMYRDGVLEAETVFETVPSDLGATTQDWIGRSPYGDALLNGYVDDFRIYDRALSENEVKELSNEYQSSLNDEFNNAMLDSGLKNVVKEDIALPTSVGDTTVTWTSSDPAHITADGKVTRPTLGEMSADVTLTAEISENGETRTETFEVSVAPEGGGTYALNITGERGADISDTMVGLFFEDINYAADGGLYAEMVENRSFEARYADNEDFDPVYDGGWAWSAYPSGNTGASMEYKTDEPLNENNTHYLEFTPSADQNGFANSAYDGLSLKDDMTYHGSLYAKTDDFTGTITVSAVKDGVAYAESEINGITSEWAKYTFDMTASEAVRGAQFVITANGTGTIDFDMISLFPDDAVDGIFRRDLAEKLKAIDPGFLRFPGGCIIEGYDLDNRYQWKNSVGPVEERVENWNRWDLHTDGYNHYNQTLGLGFYEFFLLCEYLDCEAVPVVNAGMACQFQTNEIVPIDSDEFRQYIDDALDLIEFANGGTDTEWGALRAEMGHPEPFNITMIGVGNEQWNTEENQFFDRFEAFENAIHEVYPEIGIIGTAGPDVTSSNYTNAWEWIRENMQSDPNFVYAVDEHYYMVPDWFLQNTDFYDSYPRDVKVFAGEYASRTRNKPNDPEANTLYTALTEAAYFTGLERNSDVVVMSCYAPLFARIGYTQWSPDLIWFDDTSSYGSPSYYVQKMNGNNLGDYNLISEIGEGSNTSGMYTNVSYDETAGEIIIKAVNVTEDEKALNISIDGYSVVPGNEATVISLTGNDPDLSNSIDAPNTVTDQTTSFTLTSVPFTYMTGPYTYSILRIPASRNSGMLGEYGSTDTHASFITGRSDTEFAPEAPLTRAELATMISRLSAGYNGQYTPSFTDVSNDDWYADAVGFMQTNGAIEGYEDGSFRPNNNVTVTEFKTIMSRLGYMCGLEDSDTPLTRAEAVKQICILLGREPNADTLPTGIITFADVPANSEYYIYIAEAANPHTFTLENGVETWTALG